MKVRPLFCTSAVLVLAATAAAGVKVALDQVPAAAVKAVKERFPKAEIRFVDKEGKDRYEFAMKEGDRQFDVGVTAEGRILNVKEEIAAEKVPDAVKEGVKKKFPDAEIVEAEKITTGDGKEAKVTYEMVIKTKKGKQGVAFDAAGKYISEAD